MNCEDVSQTHHEDSSIKYWPHNDIDIDTSATTAGI